MSSTGTEAPDRGADAEGEVPVGRQAAEAEAFVRGLVTAFGLSGEVASATDDGTVSVSVHGKDLGVLIGPRGATINAISELTRAVVQRHASGAAARVHVDVDEYRAKRRAALERFATELAEQVRDTGEEIALEPMAAPDRKVVHDVVAETAGVTTTSEGDEPRRYVVIRPD